MSLLRPFFCKTGFTLVLLSLVDLANAASTHLRSHGRFLQACKSGEVIYAWNAVDYKWPSAEIRAEYLRNGKWNQSNCAMAGLKVHNGTFYVTVPRWREGVPSTLNKVVVGGDKPMLEAFPSWEMQEVGNQSALQYVQSMDIDAYGRMWIIDVGRVFKPNSRGPAKLLIMDLTNRSIIRNYEFPPDVASPESNFLNDIVVDSACRVAYISDASGDGAVVVYYYDSNSSRRFVSPTMKAEKMNMRIQGKDFGPLNTPIDGIALSTATSTLYYCPLAGYSLYSINTSQLQEGFTNETAQAHVVKVGDKVSPSDGMLVDKSGRLIFGGLITSSVYAWDPSQPLQRTTQVPLACSDEDLQWPDTFAKDEAGSVYVLSNRLHRFQQKSMDMTGAEGPNFRVVKIT